MKILHVITAFGIGGAEILLKNLAVLFKAKKVDISIIALIRAEEVIPEFLTENGIEVIYCPVNKKASIMNIWFLIKHLKANQYDIIHVHLSYELYIFAFINLLFKLFFQKGLTLIVTEHNTIMERRDNILIKLFSIERLVYHQYLKVVCISKEVSDCVSTYAKSEKCVVIANGIKLEEAKNNYNVSLRLRDPIILYVGTLCDRKDPATLVRAMKFVEEEAKLFLVGDGPNRCSLELLVKEMQLQNRVFFLGKRFDVFQLMQSAVIYVQPSLYEGFALAVLEAMASGLPVISSDVPGVHELVSNVGLFYPVSDEKKLAALIRELLASPALLIELSGKSAKKAQNYSIQKTADDHYNLYLNILE